MSALSGPPPTTQQLTWLRSLVDDNGTPQLEIAFGNGRMTVFYVSAWPMVGTPVVTVDGESQTEGTDFTVDPAGMSVIFAVPPPLNAQVAIRYTRQTWSDTELGNYLVQAGFEYANDRTIVYKAGVYVIDTLLAGTATAFDFGEGQENFRFSGVFQQLAALKQAWEEWVENDAENGLIELHDLTFPSLEPLDIRTDPAGQLYSGTAGWFPDQPSGYGGLD